jgi:hypothetical protein
MRRAVRKADEADNLGVTAWNGTGQGGPHWTKFTRASTVRRPDL